MSILDINIKTTKKLQKLKTIFVYLLVSILCIAADKIYAIFGHGVTSDTMTQMFLYPFIGGLLFYSLLGISLQCISIQRISRYTGYRVFCNIYNSGIAVLTVGSFLKGILDIAGTSSPYITLYYQIGWLCIAFGLVLLLILIFNLSRSTQSEDRDEKENIS